MQYNKNPLTPHLQIYKWQISSLLSITHRISGILIFFLVLPLSVFIFSELTLNQDSFDNFMSKYHTNLGIKFGCIGLIFQGLEFKIKQLNNKALLYFLIIISTLLMPRISNYTSFLQNPFYFNELNAPTTNYVVKDGYGVYLYDHVYSYVLVSVQN